MKTLPEQLQDALAEIEALKGSGSNVEAAAKIAELSKQANAAKGELISATARISDLEKQLATAKSDAENAFKRGHEEAMAGLKDEIEKKAVLKACQIARSVGQPVADNADNGKNGPNTGRGDHIEAVASGYRSKYGIS